MFILKFCVVRTNQTAHCIDLKKKLHAAGPFILSFMYSQQHYQYHMLWFLKKLHFFTFKISYHFYNYIAGFEEFKALCAWLP